jgi:cyclophilin family peptidyl-prolyl cis-trans isomerase
MKKTYLYAAVVVAGATIITIGYFTRYKPEKAGNDTGPGIKVLEQSAELKTNGIKNNMNLITIKTNFGEIQFETYDSDAPKTVNNFITLAQKGFYNNLTFHRVIRGFMIQGGDPNCNPSTSSGPCGAGGPGYQFEDELNSATESYKAGYKKGVVAMANAGPNTNGSQFFIMLENYPLSNDYTIFGRVIKGQEFVDAIGNVQIGANDKPVKPVVIESVIVEETVN